jgi:hypothetical protein
VSLRRKQADPFLQIEEAQARADSDAIAKLYGRLPEWLPEPVHLQMTQALASLRNAGQSVAQIARTIAQARRNRIKAPGTAVDAVDFIKSANLLAHVQWALSLGEGRAIQELGGSIAALGNRVQRDRRALPKQGNAAKKQAALARESKWTAIGGPLRGNHPYKSDTWLAEMIARRTGDNKSTIRAAIPRLGLTKKKTC